MWHLEPSEMVMACERACQAREMLCDSTDKVRTIKKATSGAAIA
jgi:hypothetical protein